MSDSDKNTKNDLKCATKPGVSPCGTRSSLAIEGLLIHVQEPHSRSGSPSRCAATGLIAYEKDSSVRGADRASWPCASGVRRGDDPHGTSSIPEATQDPAGHERD